MSALPYNRGKNFNKFKSETFLSFKKENLIENNLILRLIIQMINI
jgi:hypothetical protein